MHDYEKGQRQGIKDSLNEELKSTLIRIERAEEAIERLNTQNWSILRKLELMENMMMSLLYIQQSKHLTECQRVILYIINMKKLIKMGL